LHAASYAEVSLGHKLGKMHAPALSYSAEIALKWINVPLGSIRVSLGYMSTFEDSYALVDFIRNTYCDRHATYGNANN